MRRRLADTLFWRPLGLALYLGGVYLLTRRTRLAGARR